MSDTEREAFGAWFRRQYDRDLVSKFEIAERAYIEGRRSTTTEARAPLSDEQLNDAGHAHFRVISEGRGGKAAAEAMRSVLAARAPAPPSDAMEALRLIAWSRKPGEALTAEHAARLERIAVDALAGPPAPSVPSVSVDPAPTPLQAVQRPAGGDEV